MQRILVDLLKFLQPFLKSVELKESIRVLYRGSLRVLLVLLHDFPDFLAEYHFSFCDAIPSTCIQLRNMILSAFPRDMKLPDPFTPELKVDLLGESKQSPMILSDYLRELKRMGLVEAIEAFFSGKSSDATELKAMLLKAATSNTSTESKYSVPLINALSLFVGIHGISEQQAQQGAGNAYSISKGLAFNVIQFLMREFESEGT